MITLRSRAIRQALVSAALAGLVGCAGEPPDDDRGEPAGDAIDVSKPSHDLALYYLRAGEMQDVRLMSRLAAEKLPEDEATQLTRHFAMLETLTHIGALAKTRGPLVDGCLRLFFVAPYRDRTPQGPFRDPGRIEAIARELERIEANGFEFSPTSDEPRYALEIASLMANLDQYGRVEALLATVPDDERTRWWRRYITTIANVRRAVNERWQDYDACEAAIAELTELGEESVATPTIAPMTPVILWDVGMLERHIRHHAQALAAVERAMSHPWTGGTLRDFLHSTWNRM